MELSRDAEASAARLGEDPAMKDTDSEGNSSESTITLESYRSELLRARVSFRANTQPLGAPWTQTTPTPTPAPQPQPAPEPKLQPQAQPLSEQQMAEEPTMKGNLAFPWNTSAPPSNRQTAASRQPPSSFLAPVGHEQRHHEMPQATNTRAVPDPTYSHARNLQTEPPLHAGPSTPSAMPQSQSTASEIQIARLQREMEDRKRALIEASTFQTSESRVQISSRSSINPSENQPFIMPELQLAFTAARLAADTLSALEGELSNMRTPVSESVQVQRFFSGDLRPRPESVLHEDLMQAREAVARTSANALALADNLLHSTYRHGRPLALEQSSNSQERRPNPNPSNATRRHGYDGAEDLPEESSESDSSLTLLSDLNSVAPHLYNSVHAYFASYSTPYSRVAAASATHNMYPQSCFPSPAVARLIDLDAHELQTHGSSALDYSNDTPNIILSAAPPTLPPSVEEAYRRKCIELAHRLSEVEQNNDELRLRRTRLVRGIRKMRLERAILLEALGKRMRKNGADGPLGNNDEDSEDSSESPPTVRAPLAEDPEASLSQRVALTSRKPQERPLRTKKSHRRLPGSPPSASNQQGTASGQPQPGASSSFSTPIAPAPTQNGGGGGGSGSGGGMDKPSSSKMQLQHPDSPSLPQSQLANNNSASSSSNARPLTPREMYSRHLRKEVLPSNPNLAAEISLSYDGDEKAFVEAEWRSLSAEERARWTEKYEEAMREWTRAEDARKKERSQTYRRRQHGSGGGGARESGGGRGGGGGVDDVEMGEAGGEVGDGEDEML